MPSETIESNTDVVSEDTTEGKEVLSPMPGTFYRTPGPEDDAFVQVGDSVKRGSALYNRSNENHE